MSFILDALKKSESDRQQNAMPGISDVPTANRRGTAPRLLMAVTGLLSITVVILLAVLLWPGRKTLIPPSSVQSVPAATGTEPPRATTAPALPLADEPVAPAATAVNTPATQPSTPVVTSARPEPVAQAPAGTDASVAAVAAPGPAATQKPAAPTGRNERAASAATPAPVTETESYLTFNDLRATGKLALPDMHIDLHVYSEVPAERFVFINMNQYRENATLSEGPRLRQITSEGVLLEYVGTTFLLPRE